MKKVTKLCFLFTGLLLVSWNLWGQSGSSCTDPLVAVVGTNHADNSNGDQWFVFTATANKSVTLATCGLTTEDTYVEVYNSCNGTAITSNDDDCTLQSKVTFVADSGQTFYIRWRNYYTQGSYDWVLSERDILPGDFCENAINAQVGTNHADNSNGDQWFVYTATANKMVSVSTCGLTNEDTYVVVYNSCNGTIIASNDQYCSNQSQVTFKADSGQTFYIRWRNYYTQGSYDWELSERDILPGEACQNPILAQVGTNHADNSNGDQWFVYTATANKMVSISTCGLTSEDTYVEVYNSCNGTNIASSDQYCSNQSQVTFKADSGQTYYIRWRNTYTSGNYDWALSERDILPGEACQNPILAQVGTNHADNSNGDQWFVYTATANKMVRISTCGSTTEKTNVQVYRGSCDWLNWVDVNSKACGDQSDLNFVADSGQTYYIRWRNTYTSGNYDWVLSERDILPGDFCENALNAHVGTNHADNSNGDQWFVYTATANKKVRISTCGLTTEKTYVQVYRSSCDWLDWVDVDSKACGDQSDLNFVAYSGQTYYIRWRNTYTSGNYDWALSERDILPGDFCGNALNAQVGTNHADNSNGDQWFVYTATANKMVRVSTCGLTTEKTYVQVYKGGCDWVNWFGESSWACGDQSDLSFVADSGETYYIVWRNWYTSGNYDWVLNERDILPGDFCGNALNAQVGTNHADNSNGDQWFVYTATANKSVTISTCGLTSEKTYVKVYRGSCDGLIWVNENSKACGDQSDINFVVDSGKTYYIVWRNWYTSGTYDWVLNEGDIMPGDKCENPVIARLGNNHAATSLGTRWFVFTPDQTANYIINACVGDSSFAGSLYIYSGNCSFLIYEESAWLSCDWTGTASVTLNAGQTYYITFTHDKNEDFQWTLLREEPPTKADTIEGPVALCSDVNNVVYRAPSIENATAYRWTISGYSVVDSVVTTNADSLVIAQLPATSSFTITVKGVNSYGEGSVDSLPVTVHPTPERPIVTRSGNVLTSSATTGNQWYNLSGLIAGATGQSYTVTADGSYYVVVTSEAGCVSKASDIIEVIITSIASSVISDHLRIFPNPVTEQLTIELVNSKSPASYVLYGVDGKQVAKGQLVGSVTLSTKQLKAGMYTLRVVQDGNVEVRKVLKQ